MLQCGQPNNLRPIRRLLASGAGSPPGGAGQRVSETGVTQGPGVGRTGPDFLERRRPELPYSVPGDFVELVDGKA